MTSFLCMFFILNEFPGLVCWDVGKHDPEFLRKGLGLRNLNLEHSKGSSATAGSGWKSESEELGSGLLTIRGGCLLVCHFGHRPQKRGSGL